MYHDDQLKEFRSNFLANVRPEELSRLRNAGELDDHLQERADACSREATRLVEQGTTFEAQAWQWAIRTELLESERD